VPYFEIDQAAFDGLDEAVKGGFKPYEPEDVTGLKNKANEAVNEVKTAKARIKELDAELASAKLQKPAGEADKLQQQLDDANAKLAESQRAYGDLQGKVVKGSIDGEAGKLAASLTKDTARASLLAEKIASRLSYEDGSFKVLDASGKLTVSSITDLAAEVKGLYPFLVDGSQAKGGGAAVSQGGAVEKKVLKRSEFEALSPQQKAEAMKSGATLTDE